MIISAIAAIKKEALFDLSKVSNQFFYNVESIDALKSETVS